MIVECVEKGNTIFPKNPAFQKAIRFIKKALNEDLAVRRYEIQGDDIFARVMAYPLKDRDIARYEAHEKYVDIQASLIGAEGMECFFLVDQQPLGEYNIDKDVIFYNNQELFTARVDVYPGTFVVFFPHDVHKPQLKVDDMQDVKKVVVKIKKSLLF